MHALLVFALEQEWRARHETSAAWLDALARIAPWVFVAGVALLVLRALLHRSRYRAVAAFSVNDQALVRHELAQAERRTIGEILPVVVERADEHPQANWIAAMLFVVAGSVLLSPQLPWDQPALLLACQLALGAAGFVLARFLPGFQALFVTDGRAARVCEEQALQEFYRHGLHRTANGTGILIFVSLLEHRVVVLGDEGIARKSGQQHWPKVNEAILAGIRRGSVREGLVEGIRLCGEELERHFPWTEGDRNEIPDRVIVRRQ
jgi:putative membrane protein